MVDLESVKQHLPIEDDNESIYLQTLIDAATFYVTSLTDIENDMDAPATYDIAILLLIGHWFAQREAASTFDIRAIPFGFKMILQSLRKGSSLV